jgi:CBS domain-containing protein
MLVEHLLLERKDQHLISIDPGATVRQALLLLVKQRVRSLPVLDSSGKLVGIFTDRDLLLGQARDQKGFHRRLIKDVMTPEPVACAPGDSVQDVLETMSRLNVGQLPVVQDDVVIGVVSAADLVNSLYSQAEAEKEHLITYIHGPCCESTSPVTDVSTKNAP